MAPRYPRQNQGFFPQGTHGRYLTIAMSSPATSDTNRPRPAPFVFHAGPTRSHSLFANVSSSFHPHPAARPEPPPNPGRPEAPRATHPHFVGGWRWVSPRSQAAAQQVTGRCQAGVDSDGRGGVGERGGQILASQSPSHRCPARRERAHARRQAGAGPRGAKRAARAAAAAAAPGRAAPSGGRRCRSCARARRAGPRGRPPPPPPPQQQQQLPASDAPREAGQAGVAAGGGSR